LLKAVELTQPTTQPGGSRSGRPDPGSGESRNGIHPKTLTTEVGRVDV